MKDFVAVKIESSATGEPWCCGAPVGWLPPSPPEDWKPSKQKPEKGKPELFDVIDNPGDWSTCSHQAAFSQKKGKKCGQHQLPMGVVPVSLKMENELAMDGNFIIRDGHCLQMFPNLEIIPTGMMRFPNFNIVHLIKTFCRILD